MTALFNRIYLAAWRTLHREEGQTFVEYAVLTALVALAITVTLTAFGTEVGTAFSKLTTKLQGIFP